MGRVLNQGVRVSLESEDGQTAERLGLPFAKSEEEGFAMAVRRSDIDSLSYIVLSDSQETVESFLTEPGARQGDSFSNIRSHYETAKREISQDVPLSERTLRLCCSFSQHVAVLMVGNDQESIATLLDKEVHAAVNEQEQVIDIRVESGKTGLSKAASAGDGS